MEIWHPVGGPFGREFSAFVIIAEFWRPEVEYIYSLPHRLWTPKIGPCVFRTCVFYLCVTVLAFSILAFFQSPPRNTWKFLNNFACFGKTTPDGKIFKIRFWKFTWRNRLTLLCCNVVKFVRRQIGEIVRYLPDKNTKFWLSRELSLLHGSRPKSARAIPQHLAHIVPDFIPIGSCTFGGVVADRVNAVLLAYRVNPKAYWRVIIYRSGCLRYMVHLGLLSCLPAV